MTFISDLAARAIAFITAVQTALVNTNVDDDETSEKPSILTIALGKNPEEKLNPDYKPDKKLTALFQESALQKKFSDRAIELVWIGNKTLDKKKAIQYTIKLCANLVVWINRNKGNGIITLKNNHGNFPTPFQWKETIEGILYKIPGERILLASDLQYLPIQIILGMNGGKYNVREQRIFQMWKMDETDREAMLTVDEMKIQDKFIQQDETKDCHPEDLLSSHSALISHLVSFGAPLSFELIFSEELREITANRAKRREEERITNADEGKDNRVKFPDNKNKLQQNTITDRKDAFEQVQKDQILALAFSGGGIRSATFNLGILQGFAEKKLIGQFDYLSTVSGGGYIGSWLTSWIKRNESVVKVSNRLSTCTSPDPTGAELKPIKWLRMYSNYFAPNASIMSIDAWTVGVTWLRNTLLNQIVIFLFFLSLLFAGNLLYHIWSAYLVQDLSPSWQEILGYSTLLLVPVALLSTMGMKAYPKDRSFPFQISMKFRISIIQGIIGLALLGSYFISAWLSSEFFRNGIPATSLYDKFLIFWPVAVIAFLCLYAVGAFGGYIDCIKIYNNKIWKARGILFLTTFFSVVFGWMCLVLVSDLLESLPVLSLGSDNFGTNVLQFIVGGPLTLEVFAFAIVVRMGLLGKYFPDERREWWGRIGAYIHRLCFLWILVSTSALLGWTFIQFAFKNYAAPSIAATGGWVALVGACVKAAFSSKSAGDGNEKSAFASFLKILSMIGPYLFILGLLILLPALTNPLLSLVGKITIFNFTFSDPLLQNFVVMVVCFCLSLILASVLGVNEFSMYNFYKNRLVRAYLGGTRRSITRQKTANPFTGFDMKDDILLHQFSNKEGYHGPYQVLNCALNASEGQELDRQDRKAESFIFSPLYCGFDFSMARDPTDEKKSYDYAYRKTKEYAFKGEGPFIGTAMAISGAAVNPNQGYHSSPQIAFLLTIFNAQMGRWLGNPRKSKWQESDPRAGLLYMINDLVNKTTTSDNFVSLSDGGHFDNMGLYEMVRRKCPLIILCDAEQDDRFTCEGFANAVRRCRIDFGAEITIDISKITDRTENRYSKSHYALGNITYVGENKTGVLLYIKSSITGKEPVDVFEYALKNKTFPHQTTADQFFDEEQFESYRKLGLHIAGKVLADKEVVDRFHFELKETLQENISTEIIDPFLNLYSKFKKLFSGK